MSEHEEQVRVFDILRLNELQIPALAFIYAIPNGGHRHPATAGKLKAEGVKRGVSDICIPIPRSGFHGAYIEMKAGKNKATPEQEIFQQFVRNEGYCAGITYGADETLDVIEKYLNVKLRGR